MRKGILLFLAFGLWALPLSAQKQVLDSATGAHHGVTQYGYADRMDASLLLNNREDTGLNNLQEYDPLYLANLGSPGTPAIPLFFHWDLMPGFQWGFFQWDAYRITPTNVPYFNTQNPYTDLFYSQGSFLSQMLQGIHTQNIKPNWNFALIFNKMGSNGAYVNQKNVINQLGFSTWYHSLSQRYAFVGSFCFNGFEQQENGGISDLRYFDSVNLLARKRAPVALNYASQKWRDIDIHISQYYFMGKRYVYQKHDTDSARIYIHPRFYLSHAFDLHRSKYDYNGQNEDNSYFDTSYYNLPDSLWQRPFANELSLGLLGKSFLDSIGHSLQTGYRFQWQARIYDRFEYEQFRQTAQDTIVDNNVTGIELKTDHLTSQSDIKAEYYDAGYNAGDYLITAAYCHKIIKDPRDSLGKIKDSLNRGRPIMLLGNARLQRFSSPYFEQIAAVNHFVWKNHFSKPVVAQLDIGLQQRFSTDDIPFSARFTYVAYARPIYYDAQRRPQQSAQTQHYIHLQVKGGVHYHKIHLEIEAHYQKVLSGNVLRFPAFVERSSVFLQGFLFHHALQGRIGLDLGYNSYWLAPGYIPSLSAFAIQDSFYVGNYPVLDFWASAKVKSFSLFIKLEHLNQGFTGDNYFLVPYYPLASRSFRFGVEWTFYN